MHSAHPLIQAMKRLIALALFLSASYANAEAHAYSQSLSQWNPLTVQAALDPDYFRSIVESLKTIEKMSDSRRSISLQDRKHFTLLHLNRLYDLMQNHSDEIKTANLYGDANREWKKLKTAAVTIENPRFMNFLHERSGLYLDWLKVKR